VDDAIVVLENIVRYREKGEARLQAALIGSKEIGFTVMSMTLSLVAVFIPLIFMSGLVGRLFREFALTVTIAILISGAVSLTLTPMLCSRFLKESGQHGRLYHALERGFNRARDGYGHTLAWSVDHWRTMLIAAALILGLTFYLFSVVPKGFIPSEDTGQIIADTKAPEGVTFEQLQVLQERVTRIVQKNPNVAGRDVECGARWWRHPRRQHRTLDDPPQPQSERQADAEEVLQQLRSAVAEVHEMQVYFQNPPAIRIGSMGGSGQYQYVVARAGLGRIGSGGDGVRDQTPPACGRAGSEQQPRTQQSTGQRAHLARHRIRTGRECRTDSGDAVQRLRRQRGQYDLWRHRPVSSHHGTGAALPDEHGCA